MHEHHLPVTRTARYYTLGRPGADITDLWFLCHGYGQLAGAFLGASRALEDSGRLLVAPEGLSRFYTNHQAGAIGASWMTREDREREMADYVRFLDAVAEAVLASVPSTARRCVLGFSQGAATATRWAALGSAPVTRLVLWGGAVPPDLDLDVHRDRLRAVDLVLVLGTRDRYVSLDKLHEERRRLEGAGLTCRTLTFNGGHRLDDDTLRAVAA